MPQPHLVACIRAILVEISPLIDPRKGLKSYVDAHDIPELNIRPPQKP
jgi:hypothetical protein